MDGIEAVTFARGRRRRRLAVATVALLGALGGAASAGAAEGETVQEAPSRCGPVAIAGHYGPYDYVTEHRRLEIVERFHFTPKVEALIGGESGYLGGDLTYTLNASPNHHRALVAITRWGARTHSDKPPYLGNTIECYFDRAIRFNRKDTVVRGLYALYLKQHDRVPEALRQLAASSDLAEENGMSHFNIGMVYFEIGQFDLALAEARLADKYGYDNPALVDKLKAANHWKDAAE